MLFLSSVTNPRLQSAEAEAYSTALNKSTAVHAAGPEAYGFPLFLIGSSEHSHLFVREKARKRHFIYVSKDQRTVDGVEAVFPDFPFQPGRDSEARAREGFQRVVRFVNENKGMFAARGKGHAIIAEGLGCVDLNTEPDNLAMAGLLLRTCGITLSTAVGRAIVLRLRVYADTFAKSIVSSTLATVTGSSILLPTINRTELIEVRSEGFQLISNGDNAYRAWVEHPVQGAAFDPESITMATNPNAVKQGLARFESLVVERQACIVKAMQWFVSLNGCILPFLRGSLPSRFLVVLNGPPQSGKTTGARRMLRVLGLGDVYGDVSVAALQNSSDPGLLVLDNREQADVDQQLRNYLLIVATGGVSGRSDVDGKVRYRSAKPIVYVTSIEGLTTEELRRRCVEVEYRLPGTAEDDASVEVEIENSRKEILAGLLQVLRHLQTLPRLPTSRATAPARVSGFSGHFEMLCQVARAYGLASSRPAAWAESIIAEWYQVLGRPADPSDDSMEFLMREIAEGGQLGMPERIVLADGSAGQLYITEAAELLHRLGRADSRLELPTSPSGLAKRIRHMPFASIRIIDSVSAPEVGVLRRTKYRRALGLFVREEACVAESRTQGWPAPPAQLSELSPDLQAQHFHSATLGDVRYLWEYLPRHTGPVESLVAALKSRDRNSNARRLAISYIARAIAPLVKALSDCLFVPVPSSEDDDSRLREILELIPHIKVLDALACRHPVASGLKGMSIGDRLNNLAWRSGVPEVNPSSVIIFDDILTSGAHLCAVSAYLRSAWPNATISSLVLARRTIKTSAVRAASAG